MLSWIKQRYHWIIALVMLLELAVVGGILNNYTSLYVIPVTMELGIARADFSLAVSLKSLISFLCTMGSGVLFLRFGTKKPFLFGLFLMVAALTLLSLTQSIAIFAIASAIIGIAEALCCSAAVSRIIGDWFNRFRGTVLGLVTASTGYGASFMCILLSDIIQHSGWRTSYMTASLILLAIGVLVLLLVRNRPEDMGLAPYGIDYKPPEKKRNPKNIPWEGYTIAELVRLPIFYFTIMILFLSSFSIFLTFSMVVPHLQNQGFSPSDAAQVNSMFLIFFAVFKFVFGALADIIGAKKVAILCPTFGAIGMYLLSNAYTATDAMVGVFIYAMSIPVLTIVIPLLAYPLFGYRSHGVALGILLSVSPLGALVAEPVASTVYDRVGSYTPVFYFAAILSVMITCLFALLFIFAARARAKYEESKV